MRVPNRLDDQIPVNAATTARGVSTNSARNGRFLYCAVLAALFLLLTWPVILSGSQRPDRTGGFFDETKFHFPLIQKLAQEWPHPDLVHLGGIQMAPTYHLIMAALVHYCHFGLTGLRLATSLVSLLLVISVFWFTSKWTQPLAAFLLCLTYVFSPFMLSGAIWLMTDNFGWLFVVLALGWSAFYPAVPRRVLGGGVAAALATAFRQIHLWLIAPIAISGLLQIAPERFRPLTQAGQARSRHPARLLVSMLVAVVMPGLVILYFLSLWHGLLPPGTAEQLGTNNHFKIVPLALAQTGYCSVFLLPTVLDEFSLRARLRDWRVWAGAGICLVLAAIPRSAEKQSPSGALVSLAGSTPVIFHRLLFLLPPAALAGAALVVFFLAAQERERGREAFLLLFAFACWLTAQTAPVFALRRYCDIVQVIVIWLAALGLPFGPPRRLGFWVGTIGLVLAQCGQAVLSIFLPVLRG